MEGQTDGVPLHSNDAHTQNKELPTSPVTMCGHHPSVGPHLAPAATWRCFPSAVQASLPLLQVGNFFFQVVIPAPYPSPHLGPAEEKVEV